LFKEQLPRHVFKNQPSQNFIDVADDTPSKSFVFSAVADDAGWVGDDIRLDVESTGVDTLDLTFTYTFGDRYNYSAKAELNGQNDMNVEAEVRFNMESVIKPKANVIVVNSTEENSGLYVVGANNFRYSADEQVYMLYVTTPGTSTHFASGVNTIIVPRYLAVDSLFNDSLTSDPSGSELGGGSFYANDITQSTASAHIVAVIEKSMSNSQAEDLLYRLTHNSTAQIGNSVLVSGDAVYLLHLPSDMQSRIPYVNIVSSPLGEAPDYLSIGAIVEFVFDCLVALGTTL
jgi:hypothetical protein